MQLLNMAAQLELPVITAAADGAACEVLAQHMMDQEASVSEPFRYDCPLYGVHLCAPILKTGPLVSLTDPPHARKTCRNQPQHGTHTASLGIGYLVNKSLIDLQRTGLAGLVKSDVEDVDKQDDGAAHRLFHASALAAATFVPSSLDDAEAITTTRKESLEIRQGFEGVFVYLFIFGKSFTRFCS